VNIMATKEIIDASVLANRECNCSTSSSSSTTSTKPDCVPYPPQGFYAPYPPYPYPAPYPAGDGPEAINPCKNSIEVQIAKMSKKASVIRKMLNNLQKRRKPIIISIGGVQYNFGCYSTISENGEEVSVVDSTSADEINYGEQVEEMLVYELKAIIAKIEELSAELTESIEIGDLPEGTESTVTA
jgi:hypothetical protein